MTSESQDSKEDTYHGWVSTYWAQGMEEDAWPIFQDERHTTGDPGGWQLSGTRRLQAGDHLTLSDLDGNTLWSGLLLPSKTRWFQKVNPGSWNWHPPGVSLEKWRKWLTDSPPTRAVLQTRDVIPPPT